MSKHFVFYGDPSECQKIVGEAMVFASACEERRARENLFYFVNEMYLDGDRHIRVDTREFESHVHIYASASNYTMKCGLVRSGKIVIENGNYKAQDFLPSSAMFNKEHQAWLDGPKDTPEPIRKYRNEGGLSFCSSSNTFNVAYPVPSKFTGLMHSAIELALGANRIVDVSNSFLKTHGITRVGDTDWLVEIGKERNIARKIKKLDVNLFPAEFHASINASRLGYVPDSLYIPTGSKYSKEVDAGNIIVLSGDFTTRECYTNGWSMDKSGNTGWSFNDNGTSCVNTFMKAYFSASSTFNSARVNRVDISITNGTTSSNSYGSVSKTEIEKADADTNILSGYGGPVFMYAGMADNYVQNTGMPSTSNIDNHCDTGIGFGSFFALPDGSVAPGTPVAKPLSEFPVWAGYVKNALKIVRFGYEKVDDVITDTGITDAHTSTPLGDCPCWTYGGPLGYEVMHNPREIKTVNAYVRRWINVNGTKYYERDGDAGSSILYYVGYQFDGDSFGPSNFINWPNDVNPGAYYIGFGLKSVIGLAPGAAPLSISETKGSLKLATNSLTFSASPTDRCAFLVKGADSFYGHSAYSPVELNTYTYKWRDGGQAYKQFQAWRDCACQGPANFDYNRILSNDIGSYIQHGIDPFQGIQTESTFIQDMSQIWTHYASSGGCCVGETYSGTDGPGLGESATRALVSATGGIWDKSPTGVSIYPEYQRSHRSGIMFSYPGHETNSEEVHRIKRKDVYYVNGDIHEVPTPDNQQIITIDLPGYGPFKYQDGTFFMSYRNSSIAKESRIAMSVHFGAGNTNSSSGDGKVYLEELSGDGEYFVDWYTHPELVPPWAVASRYYFPFFDASSSTTRTQNELIYRQLFGPYVWVGAQ